MPTQIIFTFQDLLLFLLWGLVVAVFILLIMILLRSYKIVKALHKTIEDNRTHIDRTIAIVPGLSANLEKISAEIEHDLVAFTPTVDNIAETSENVTSKLSENAGLVSGIGSVVHTVSIGKALYDKYFGKKYETTMTEVKDAIYDVGETIRELERNKEEK